MEVRYFMIVHKWLPENTVKKKTTSQQNKVSETLKMLAIEFFPIT